MRLLAGLSVCGLMLAGCASGAVTTPPPESAVSSSAPSAPTTLGAELPADNPSLDRVDTAGQTPDESVLALIGAHNERDWQAVYSSYATPSADLATAEREWAQAHETYLDFRVREVRVTSGETAWVRVTYAVTPDPLSSAFRPVAVDEPGEWWPVHRVDGRWKTQWMPRQ